MYWFVFIMKLQLLCVDVYLICCVFKVAMVEESVYPFPTVDVPDHAHYIIGAVILSVGITGMLGNFLVIYAFSRWDGYPLWVDSQTYLS